MRCLAGLENTFNLENTFYIESTVIAARVAGQRSLFSKTLRSLLCSEFCFSKFTQGTCPPISLKWNFLFCVGGRALPSSFMEIRALSLNWDFLLFFLCQGTCPLVSWKLVACSSV